MNPQQIGPYEIKTEVGRGGMAMVYLARDTRTNQDVALKTLPRQFTHDPQFRSRFGREIHTVARLRHPDIVPVFDYGEDGEIPYIVMGFMPGGTLAERIAQGPMSREEAVKILRPIAAALDYAHQQGVVHRDVKPANIYFDAKGDAHLGDFGVVQLAEATRSFTGTAVIGTPAYMSPEQVKGGGKLDGRSDIYALGIVLYEMLSGEVPFKGETPTQQLMKHVLEPVPHIRERHPEIDPAIEAVLMKALAKEPAERYPTATAFIEAVNTPEAIPQQTDYYAPSPTTIYSEKESLTLSPPAQKNGKSYKMVGIVGGIIVLVLCALVAGSTALAGSFGLFAANKPTATPLATEAGIALLPSSTATTLAQLPIAGQTFTPQPTVTPLLLLTDTPTPTATASPMPTSPPTSLPMAPVVREDSLTTPEDTAGSINVTSNDSDPDGNLNPNSISILTNPAYGNVSQRGSGNIEYTPDRDYAGRDGFNYKVCDATNLCAQAAVIIDVTPVDDPPVAQDDQYQASQNLPLQISAPGVLTNDSDPDGNNLQVSVNNNPAHGTVTLQNNGVFTYNPTSQYCGSDSFTYNLSDGNGGTDTATVSVEIACNSAPVELDVQISGATPPSGSQLMPASDVTVQWNFTNNSYSGSYIFWKVELLVYNNPQCSPGGGGQISNWSWGELGWWERRRAATTGSQQITLKVAPSVSHYGDVYIAIRLSAYGGELNQLGAMLDADTANCYLSPGQ